MKHKQIVLGIIIGFILGFFVQLILQENQVSRLQPRSPAGASDSSGLPEGHPPAEIMEKLNDLHERARANPRDREVRILLGNLYYDMGRFDAAIDWYEAVLQLEPGDVNVRTDLGTAYLYTGNSMKAIELYEHSLEIEPNHPQTLQNLGFAYFSVEKFDDAVQTWQTLLNTHPKYPHVTEIREQIQSAKARMREERS